jgi:hypothetical protein
VQPVTEGRNPRRCNIKDYLTLAMVIEIKGLIKERLTGAAGHLKVEISRLRVVHYRRHDYLKVKTLV